METYSRTQYLSTSIDNAWNFFSVPGNLLAITPKRYNLQIVGDNAKKPIRKNTIIKFKMRPVSWFELKWNAKVVKTAEPLCFIDRQINGPYKFWEHKHSFVKSGDGVIVQDVIKYKLPFGIFGKLIDSLVRKKIDEMFDYRSLKLNELYGNGSIS